MRKIKLSGREYATTKYTLEAIVWATNRRGRVSWKDNNGVSTQIIGYLKEHKVDLPDLNAKRVAHVINRLVNEGYAWVKYGGHGGYGTKIVEFGFKEDVNLTGYTPQYEKGEWEKMKNSLPEQTPAVLPTPIPPPPLPPIPYQRYHAIEIDDLLHRWALQDAEGYAEWADKLIAHLGVILNG